MPKVMWIPETPAGTLLEWLAAPTDSQAWANLLEDAAHMPYRGITGFRQRGYKVNWCSVPDDWQPPQAPSGRKFPAQ